MCYPRDWLRMDILCTFFPIYINVQINYNKVKYQGHQVSVYCMNRWGDTIWLKSCSVLDSELTCVLCVIYATNSCIGQSKDYQDSSWYSCRGELRCVRLKLYLMLHCLTTPTGGLLAVLAGQVLVLRVPWMPAKTLGRLPVTLTDEHLAFVVPAWRRKEQVTFEITQKPSDTMYLREFENMSSATHCHRWPSCFPHRSCSRRIQCRGCPGWASTPGAAWHQCSTGRELGNTCRKSKRAKWFKCLQHVDKFLVCWKMRQEKFDLSRSSTGFPEPPLPQ